MDSGILQTEPAPHTALGGAGGQGSGGSEGSPPSDVGRLLRLNVPVIVKLAERRMRLADILKLTASTIIEFSKPAEEPLDLLVNNVVIGQGDVVKVGENFGLRITRIGQPAETIRALGGKER